jgi:16S rRNA (cytidine1402-2'-O)-methyltransferase
LCEGLDFSHKWQKGILYVCATPIGNLRDITLRTLDCLKAADFIAVENIARSKKLLNHYGIKTPLITYREANREKRGQEIVERIKNGAVGVLITDSGLPAISDPGSHLLQLMIKENMDFTVVPGPSAALTALIRAGYPAAKFVFWGFLSRKETIRFRELHSLRKEEKAVIIYEAPHRLLKTLENMAAVLGEREITVCRELTKKFEELKRGTAGTLLQYFDKKKPKGEITIVLAPLNAQAGHVDKRTDQLMTPELFKEIRKKLLEEIKKGSPPAEAVKKVARTCLLPKNKIYAIMIQLKNEMNSGFNPGHD